VIVVRYADDTIVGFEHEPQLHFMLVASGAGRGLGPNVSEIILQRGGRLSTHGRIFSLPPSCPVAGILQRSAQHWSARIVVSTVLDLTYE
jgi:hypothetical protein